ncbi:MAG TPA: glycosyl hydrolase, partial [Opitutaceae bacterium]|nr:glycosyl hydrolase [Opitutaceae bacterium]
MAAPAGDLNWPKITREAKPWTRWWWPASAVDKENLQRELKLFSDAGFGGVEVTPIYGAKGAEKRFISFLSDQYMDVLAYTATEGHRLGLGVDMATGTGWPFGGPWITGQFAEQKIEFKDGQIVISPTKFHVKRSAPGDEGFVVNPLSPKAAAVYLAPFTKALVKLPPGSIDAQFHDSYEYTASWSEEIPDKFKAMHGYDLRDHVAELSGVGDADTVNRIKTDYRETLSQLHYEFVQTWVDWSHQQHSLAREQAHGAPGNLLDLYALADVPETETFGSANFPIPGYRNDPSEIGVNEPQTLVNRFASSAANVAGRPLSSSETFTWMREHFHEAPSEMKPELDQLFLTGINRIYYHGSCYSPADVAWPGWLFYASTQFNWRNPLWRDFAELNAYIARSQSLLQASQTDNDILLYWPIFDQWNNNGNLVEQFTMHSQWLNDMPCGVAMRALSDKGYSFDLISDSQLLKTEANGGELKTPGHTYRTLLVPKTDRMPLATLQRLVSLAHDGATVCFIDALPADVPGFSQLTERRIQFKTELAKLGSSPTAKGNVSTYVIGKGRVVVAPFSDLLTESHATREALVDLGLSVLRKKSGDSYVYFVTNLSGKTFDGWAPFSHAGRSAVLLDARSGRTGVAYSRNNQGNGEVYLQLAPGESIFVRTLSDHTAQGQLWPYAKPSGAPVPVSGEWHVTFVDGGPELPSPLKLSTLKSWTDGGSEAAQHFGGTARYETEITLPAGKFDDWELDLGDVRETARVFVNGKEVDRLWSLPF